MFVAESLTNLSRADQYLLLDTLPLVIALAVYHAYSQELSEDKNYLKCNF